MSAAKAAVLADSGDVNILVIGDSTGDASDEWVYLFATDIGNLYPTHSVELVPFQNFTSKPGAYGAPVSISTGSGANTIRFHNCSVSLTIPAEWVGVQWANAIDSVPTPDLIIWNHGHNISSSYFDPTIRGSFSSAFETVRARFPASPQAAVLQNPRRDDDQQAVKIQALQWLASRRLDLTLIDFYSHWIAAGKPAGWYTDNMHPNAAGSAENASVALTAWNATIGGTADVGAPWIDTIGTNLLVNGDFADWSGAAPANWTPISGTVTTTKDTVVKADAGDAYSLKLEYNTAGSTRQDLSSGARASLAGKTCTLAVLAAINPASPRLVPGLSILIGAPSTGNITYSGGVVFSSQYPQSGRFLWGFLQGVPVPADVTTIRATLTIGTSPVAGDFVHIQRAVLVEGDLPKDMA